MVHRRILIVEDDPDTRRALADAMRGAGAEVVVAEDGHDALERLRAGPRPAVILLDLRPPGLGGEEFLRALRADPRYEHVPVITMSGSGPGEGDAVVARLQRAVDVDDLRQIVESLLHVAA